LEFSFSTGLKFSPRRPFRIVALSDDPAGRLWVANYSNVAVLELGHNAAPRSNPADGWARLVERTLAAKHVPFLAAQISKRRFDLSLDDLPALGLQLLEDLDATECRGDGEPEGWPVEQPSMAAGRAHAAHRQFAKSLAPVAAALPTAAPEAHHGLHSPQVIEKLEHLDDLVYEAISGSFDAMERLQTQWPRLCSELGAEVLAESREQYLRYALAIWEECADRGGIRNPTRALQAIDVLCLLFGEAAGAGKSCWQSPSF
jgi:hypothetical protein